MRNVSQASRRRVASCFRLWWRQRSKYNAVARALPFPSGEKACRWRLEVRDGGRKVLVPIR